MDFETPSRVILFVVRSFQSNANCGFRANVSASGWGNMFESAPVSAFAFLLDDGIEKLLFMLMFEYC